MARAKRTDRAEARRRARTQLATESAGSPGSSAPPVARTPSGAATGDPGDRTRSAAAREQAPGRGRITSALARAYRPAHVREDLSVAPKLARRPALWLPILISAAVASAVVAFQGRELITAALSQYFLGPVPIGAAFFAGFLAPRASYLIGAIVGLAVAVITIAAGSAFGGVLSGAAVVELLVYAPVTTMLFAAVTAWYRRFLGLIGPAGRMAAERQTVKPKSPRRR